MEDNNLNVLDEINKGATMGMDAINYVLDKVEDTNLKKVLDGEYNKYRDISNRVNEIYNNYTVEKEPHKTNTMNKMMTWYGVQMKTMNDQNIYRKDKEDKASSLVFLVFIIFYYL